MKIACVYISNYFLQAHPQYTNNNTKDAVIIGNEELGVLAFSQEAASMGITYDISLQQALMFAPHSLVLEPSYDHYRNTWFKLLNILEYYSVLVEDHKLGHAYIQIPDKFDGPQLLNIIKKELNLNCNLGIASGKFPSFVAALHAKENNELKIINDVKQFLSSIPIDVLPISFETKKDLISFGLRKLGDISKQRIGPMESQFGDLGKFIWNLSNGTDDRTIVSRSNLITVSETIEFDYPITDLKIVLLGIKNITNKAYMSDKLSGRFAGLASVDIYISGRPFLKIDVPFWNPISKPEDAFRIIKNSVNRAVFNGVVYKITLRFLGIQGESSVQSHFLQNIDRDNNLVLAINQIKLSMNNDIPIYKIQEVNKWSKHPEERFALVDYFI